MASQTSQILQDAGPNALYGVTGQTALRALPLTIPIPQGQSSASYTVRNTTFSAGLQSLFLLGLDGGLFRRDPTDTTSAEDGGAFSGTIIRSLDFATNGVWKRVYSGPRDIRWYGAKIDGLTDDTGAWQATHDSLPATGGGIWAPDGSTLLNVNGTYVNITKPNVSIIGSSGALLISPNSANAEDRTGNSILNGFNVTGDNFTYSLNTRGPLIKWTPGTAADKLSVRDCYFLNMYNSGISIANTAFDVLDVNGVLFNTSRDLASDAGNYEAISRSANSTDPAGNLIRVNRCTFRGVSGGIDAHNVRNLEIGGGTRFEGVDINAIKLATADNLRAELNVTVDESVTFDGTAINAASANRHLSATGVGRAAPGTQYMGFMSVFSTVRWHARTKNAPNQGVEFFDGTFNDAVLNLDGSKWDTCPKAIVDCQGTISMNGMHLVNSNVIWTSAGRYRSLRCNDGKFKDSYINLTKFSLNTYGRAEIMRNDIDYSLDNLAPIRLTNYGTDNAPLALIENNSINLTGVGNTLCIDGSTTGFTAFLKNNTLTAAGGTPTTNGRSLNTYEQQTAPGNTSLLLPVTDGSVTVVNPNSTGAITYNIQDAAMAGIQVGSRFSLLRLSAANALAAASVGGAINGGTTVTLGAQYSSCILEKTAANTWVVLASTGTVTIT